MKKCFGLLLALLLMLTGILAFAESGEGRQPGFYLYERRLVPTDGGCVLHLRILMVNDTAYCLDGVDVRLLDAQGQEIVPLSVRMEAPLNPVPAGETFFPVTLYYTLPEGCEAADFQVTGVPGEAYDEPAAEALEFDTGHILLSSGNGPALVAWMEERGSKLYMSGYMAVYYLYDVDGNYLGSTTVSWEDAAVHCPASDAMANLEAISGLPEMVLEYYNIDFNEGSYYYLFDDVRLTGLAKEDIPYDALVHTYRTKSPMSVVAATFEELPDGLWRAYALLQNGACEPVHLDAQQAIVMDADGNEICYEGVTSEYALWEVDAFSITTAWMTFSGIPEGVVPADLRVHGRATHEEASSSVKRLDAEHYRVRKIGSRMILTGSVPGELLVDQNGDGETSCDGIIWYARHPEDNSMISCGFEHTVWPIVGEDSYVFDQVEIPNVPEGVTPEMLVFFINAK